VIAREENAKMFFTNSKLISGVSLPPNRGITGAVRVNGAEEDREEVAKEEEKIDEDIPFTLKDSKVVEKESKPLRSSSTSGGTTAGIISGAWLHRLGSGFSPAGRWMQGARQQ
jgi:hypothetical protein